MALPNRVRVAAAITVGSAVAHLWKLGLRPLAHDEAIDAYFSWQARNGAVMEYDPIYHGPLRFYLEGLVLEHIGTGAEHARLVAALAGIAATLVIALSTETLGKVGAPVAAVVFTVSPTILTVTRTGREDSLVGLVELGLLLVVARALTRPRPVHLVAGGVLLATSFGLKETTFLFGLNAALFFVAAGTVAAWRPDGQCRAAVRRLRSVDGQAWVWTATAFVAVFLVIFTSGFRYAEGVESGMFDGVRYWWSQHDVRRGGQPWFFYLAVYGAYEWLLLGLAAVGGAVALARRSLVGTWFVAMALGNLALYSWAGEKFAWLALHPLVPAVLLAGIGAQAAWDGLEGRPALARRAVLGLGVAAATITALVAVRPAITDGADPRELLVTVQTSDDVPPLAERLRTLQGTDEIEGIFVDQTGGGSWPWAWYLHGLDDVGYGTLGTDVQELPPGFDAYIVLALEQPPVVPEGYELERFRLREWWVPAYAEAGVGDIATWLGSRQTWSPTASFDQYLVIRSDALEPRTG